MSITSVKLPPSCSKPEFLAKGKRGDVYKVLFNNKPAVIKVARVGSAALFAADMETTYLSKVNIFNIGPKLYASGSGFVIMEFIDGLRIDHFVEQASAEDIKKVLGRVFDQLIRLDKEHINKFELTNPYKHILVKDDLEPVLIDFERARHTTRPKNVSQFAEYVLRHLEMFEKRGLIIDAKEFRDLVSSYQLTGAFVFAL